jgi:hypothetical protein
VLSVNVMGLKRNSVIVCIHLGKLILLKSLFSRKILYERYILQLVAKDCTSSHKFLYHYKRNDLCESNPIPLIHLPYLLTFLTIA